VNAQRSAKIQEGGHFCPPIKNSGGLENPPSFAGDGHDGQGVERDSGDDRGMSEWQTKRLGDVLQLNYGKSLSVKNRVEGPIPVYGSNGIVGSHNEAIVDAPGLIVGRKGSAGQVHRSLGPFCPIDTTFYVTAADAPDTDLEFLFYLLRYIDLTRITGDVGVPGLNREMAYMEPVHFPAALPEQKKIAQILSTVQRAIEAQERIIQTTTELKKALMHKLFTEGLPRRSLGEGGPPVYEPQKQTEIGPVPESWEVVDLGELLTIAQYGMSVKGNPEGNYPILRMTNQVDGQIVDRNLQYVEIGDADFSKFRVERGDILFNRTNSLDLVGRTAIFDIGGDFVFASYLIRIRADQRRLNPFFLNCYFNTDEVQARLKSIATRAVSQSNISATRLKGFPVPKPSLDEQDKIVEYAKALDRKLAVHRGKLEQLQDLFRTLLHELMTAKIRAHEVVLATSRS
jgi:type I restriction enzyme, S subunit